MACGGSDDEPALTGEPETTGAADDGKPALEVAAKDIAFDKTTLKVSAGSVTPVAFDNQDDGIMHNLHVTGSGVDEKTEIQTGPAFQTLELDLEPGTYSYVCDVHPQQLKGDLEFG